MSTRETILDILLTSSEPISCQQITDAIIKNKSLTGNVARYKSGSVSSLLAGMVKQGVIAVSDEKTPRGGKTYQLINKLHKDARKEDSRRSIRINQQPQGVD